MIKVINSIEDVELFASQLVNDESLSFHPDDDFSNYVNLETKERLYSDEEAASLNQLMEKCFVICQQNDTDIYELMEKPLYARLGLGDNVDI